MPKLFQEFQYSKSLFWLSEGAAPIECDTKKVEWLSIGNLSLSLGCDITTLKNKRGYLYSIAFQIEDLR